MSLVRTGDALTCGAGGPIEPHMTSPPAERTQSAADKHWQPEERSRPAAAKKRLQRRHCLHLRLCPFIGRHDFPLRLRSDGVAVGTNDFGKPSFRASQLLSNRLTRP